MALITCPECKRIISEFAISCPSCGYPLREMDVSKKEEESEAKASSAPATSRSWKLPPIDLFGKAPSSDSNLLAFVSAEKQARAIEQTLSSFGCLVNVVDWTVGPSVTQYALSLPDGMKTATDANLTTDLARTLGMDCGLRIFSPVPGTPYVGLEVPNHKGAAVYPANVLKDAPAGPLQLAIGKDVAAKPVVADLAKMPHLLIGGTTGSGKGMVMHGLIASILMHATPDEVRFIMIDLRRAEFWRYEGIPHLCTPPVTDPKGASGALVWAVSEVERRLKILDDARARDIDAYNDMVEAKDVPGDDVEVLPRIVIIISELADLMMCVGKEAEFTIARLAAHGGAVGVHLIIATNRPDSSILTGPIKANITNRIALKVPFGINSRVIIDQTGAENLIGRCDMLFRTADSPNPTRVQGCWVSDKETESVVNHWRTQAPEGPAYDEPLLQAIQAAKDTGSPEMTGKHPAEDSLLWEAADLVVSENFAITSFIQRKLSVGYSRAERIMDKLEELGIVGPPQGPKPRDVLVGPEDLAAIKKRASEPANNEAPEKELQKE